MQGKSLIKQGLDLNPAYMSRAAEEFLKPNALGMNCEMC